MMLVRDEYIAPVATLVVGDREWQPSRYRVVSSRLEPADVATIVLDNRAGDVDVPTGSRVHLWSGYRESGEAELFDGVVEGQESDDNTDVLLHARDFGAVTLGAMIAPMGFDVATPTAVLTYIATQCGMALMPESKPQLAALPPKKFYVLRWQSGLSAVREVLGAWGVAWDVWCEIGGNLYVGTPELTQRYLSDRYVIEWGESMLDFQLPQEGSGRIVTVGLPIHHSSQIVVDAPEFRGLGLVDRVTWSHWPHSRTEVTWHPII